MSVNADISIQGTEDLAQAMQKLDAQTKTQVQDKLAEWAQRVKAEAERIVPVRTGYLLSTIYARTGQWQAQVGAEASYAASVEFGTFRARAKPFIQPAVELYLPELEQLITQALEIAKGEAGL